MYGNTTCFVYDEPSNRYQYASGEINDDTLEPFFNAESIEVENLEDNSNVSGVMISEFIAECAPANNVQDDGFIPAIRKLFGEESKLYVATDGNNHKTFMLVY